MPKGINITIKEYASDVSPTWCPGCGDFAIWAAIKNSLVAQKLDHTKVLFNFDVGCHGNMQDKMGGYRFAALHGRVIPAAIGGYIANPN